MLTRDETERLLLSLGRLGTGFLVVAPLCLLVGLGVVIISGSSDPNQGGITISAETRTGLRMPVAVGAVVLIAAVAALVGSFGEGRPALGMAALGGLVVAACAACGAWGAGGTIDPGIVVDYSLVVIAAGLLLATGARLRLRRLGRHADARPG
jgi:hypothetical protein